jgi:hypothetical protein
MTARTDPRGRPRASPRSERPASENVSETSASDTSSAMTPVMAMIGSCAVGAIANRISTSGPA